MLATASEGHTDGHPVDTRRACPLIIIRQCPRPPRGTEGSLQRPPTTSASCAQRHRRVRTRLRGGKGSPRPWSPSGSSAAPWPGSCWGPGRGAGEREESSPRAGVHPEAEAKVRLRRSQGPTPWALRLTQLNSAVASAPPGGPLLPYLRYHALDPTPAMAVRLQARRLTRHTAWLCAPRAA